MIAINDSFYLLTSVFTIINEYLHDHPMYPRFYELYSQVSRWLLDWLVVISKT
jgi:hypothetical protein